MKIFVYKTLFVFACIFIIFQLTIGIKIKQFSNDLQKFKSKDNVENITKFPFGPEHNIIKN